MKSVAALTNTTMRLDRHARVPARTRKGRTLLLTKATTGDSRHFGALSHDERVHLLGEAILRSGALVFTKNHAGKYTAVNDDFLDAFGLSSSEEIVGLDDDQLVEKVLASGEKIFHHSYRGESITDLPAIWREHDEMALQRPMWFKERAILNAGEDAKLHEFVVMKAPLPPELGSGIIGVAVSEGT